MTLEAEFFELRPSVITCFYKNIPFRCNRKTAIHDFSRDPAASLVFDAAARNDFRIVGRADDAIRRV
jgi:hypothetical protein